MGDERQRWQPLLVEIVRAHRGRLELVGEHARRLAAAARAAGFAAEDATAVSAEAPTVLLPSAAVTGSSAPDSHASTIEAELVAAWQAQGARDRLFLVRQSATGRTIEAAPEDAVSAEVLAAGVHVVLHPEVEFVSPPPPALGSLKWSRFGVAAMETSLAIARGAHESLRLSTSGAVVGAALKNLFLVLDGALVTPAAETGAFAGLGRAAVLAAARGLGVPTRETTVTPADLARADDAFLVSSAAGILSVQSIDGRELRAPPRGSPWRALVPRLRLRYFELTRERLLPDTSS